MRRHPSRRSTHVRLLGCAQRFVSWAPRVAGRRTAQSRLFDVDRGRFRAMISARPNSSHKVGGVAMSRTMTRLMAAGLVAVALPSFATIAAAAPTSGALALKNAAPSNIETVRWVGWGGWGWGRGWGVGAGIAAGAVIGGLIAAPY